MDKAPECPPRPDKSLMEKQAKNYENLRKQSLLLNMVPPLPSSLHNKSLPTICSPSLSSSMTTTKQHQTNQNHSSLFLSNNTNIINNPSTTSAHFINHQSNVLYNSCQQPQTVSQNQPIHSDTVTLSDGTIIQRPSTLLTSSNKPPSLMPGCSLIDFDSRNACSLSLSANELENNQKVESIKKLINNTYSNISTPEIVSLNSPLIPGSKPLNGGICFIHNPLYTNLTPTMTNNNSPIMPGIVNPGSYSNLLTQTYSNNAMIFNSPIHRQRESFDAFLYQQQIRNDLMNNEILEKINNVVQEQQQMKQHQHMNETNILSPISTIQQDRNDFLLPRQEILSLFDPLSQNDTSYHIQRATHSPIPMFTNDYETHHLHNDDSNNQNHSLSTIKNISTSILSEDFTQINIKSRPNCWISSDLEEFIEHLRALYLSIKSKNTPITSLGLIWSPRIDNEHVESGHVGSSDQYMISPGKKIRETKRTDNDNGSQTDFLLEVRYNSLIHCKLNSLPLPKPITGHDNAGIDRMNENSEHNWYSIKIPATMQSVVEAIVLYIIHNVGKENSNIDPDNFLIKVYDLNEYLIPKSDLFSYVYVQKCKRLNQDVVLEMIDTTLPEFWRPFYESNADSRLLNDDIAVKKSLSFDSHIKFSSTNESLLKEKIDKLFLLFAQFLSLTDIVNLIDSEKNLFTDISNCIKSIQTFLSGMIIADLILSIEEMNILYNRHILKQSALHSDNIFIDNEVLRDNFRVIFNNITDSLIKMLNLYSNKFPVNFEVVNTIKDNSINNNINNNEKKKEESISRNIQHLKLKVDSLFQISTDLRSKYQFFFLRAIVSYGFKVLDYKLISKQSNQNLDWIIFNQELKFDSIILSELPREARINFELIGALNSSANRNEFEIVASTFFHIFNHNRSLEQGTHLLTFNVHTNPINFTANTEQIAMIKPKIIDDNHVITLLIDPESMMMIFSLPQTEIRYFFPEVERLKYKSNKKSISRQSSSNRISLDSVVPLPVKSFLPASDSLYGFYGFSTSNISEQNRLKIIDIVQRNPLEGLSIDECKLIWDDRWALSNIPGAILKILKAPSSFSSINLQEIYSILEEYDLFYPSPLSLGSNRLSGNISRSKSRKLPFVNPIEALQLLGSDYPDQIIRRKAVWWLKTVSTDELCDYLPQLIQALRYEPYLDCHLIWLLLECSLISARFCHYFYWLLKSNHQDSIFGYRAQFYTRALQELCTGHCSKMSFQEDLCSELAKISADIKSARDSSRNKILAESLINVNNILSKRPIPIPLSPSVQVDGLYIEKCSFFNSNSLPLKIVFSSAPPYRAIMDKDKDNYVSLRSNLIKSIYKQKKLQSLKKTVIFKCGDDLRQDMLVMQIISIINRIWLKAGLDLRLVTFGVMNSHERTGMIEMVSHASTLREIQVEHGVAGNFKHKTISEWLKRHNTNTYQYLMAVENFLHSCAGYVVITYLLGICDRHNDNIMITTSGHLFHIDFGKFLGDAQTISGFKRDRAPFVFTEDMLYVINDGDKPSKNYQFFVELCCNCFSIVRQNGNFLLSLLSTMIPSGIFGLSSETVKYFHKALMTNATDCDAKAQFNLLIEKSRKSIATQVNFLMHNLAQIRFTPSSTSTSTSPSSSSSSSAMIASDSAGLYSDTSKINANISEDFSDQHQHSWKFSFSVKRSTMQEDGRIIGIDVIGFKKRGQKSEKVYYNKIKITREKNMVTHVYRSYKEFVEFTEKLAETFKLAGMTKLPRSPILSRSNRYEVAKQRCEEIQCFIENFKRYSPEIYHSDIVYTFFHQIHRDIEILEAEPNVLLANLKRKVKLTITYLENEKKLHVLVGHARNLESTNDLTPSTYVKLYLVPDQHKNTKRKTRIMIKNANPTYMDTIVYDGYSLEELKTKALQVSVWAYEMSGNHKLGFINISLCDLNLSQETEQWYTLNVT